MKKYICYGGHIPSQHGGDWHYISAARLTELYRVPRHECILVNKGEKDRYRLAGIDTSRFIKLYPDFSGKYIVPEQQTSEGDGGE